MKELIENIKNLVRLARLDEAFDELLKVKNKLDKNSLYSNLILNQNNRYITFKRDKLSGVLRSDEKEFLRNDIIAKLLELIDEVDKEYSKTQPKSISDSTNHGNKSEDVDQPREEEVREEPIEKYLALIMKGGGVKGLAYVGAIKVLEKEFKFNWFIGTSAGAIAAVLLGAGYDSNELEDLLFNKKFKDFLDAKWFEKATNLTFKKGLHNGHAFKSWISDLLVKKLKSKESVKMHALPYRVTIFASTRELTELRFDSNAKDADKYDASYAVRCSMSIPGVFTPEYFNGKRVFDGGLQNNYPVQTIKNTNPDLEFIGLFLGAEYYEEGDKETSALNDLAAIAMEAKDWEALREYKDETLVIDPRPIVTMDFDITDEEKRFLVKAGSMAAKKFLANRFPDKYDFPTNELLTFEREREKLTAQRKFKKQRRKFGWFAVLLFFTISLFFIIFQNKIWPEKLDDREITTKKEQLDSIKKEMNIWPTLLINKDSNVIYEPGDFYNIKKYEWIQDSFELHIDFIEGEFEVLNPQDPKEIEDKTTINFLENEQGVVLNFCFIPDTLKGRQWLKFNFSEAYFDRNSKLFASWKKSNSKKWYGFDIENGSGKTINKEFLTKKEKGKDCVDFIINQ